MTSISTSAIQTPLLPAVGNEDRPDKQTITQRLDTYMQRHEMAYERMASVRARCKQSGLGKSTALAGTADQVLSLPEQFRSPLLRGLIGAGKWLEEMAEACSDLSGMLERAIRNASSGGNKADLALVIASGGARAVTGQLSIIGFAPHKAAGAGLYGLAALCSALAVALSKTRMGAKRDEARMRKAMENSTFDNSLYQMVGRKLLHIKQALLGNALSKLGKRQGKPSRWARVCCLHLSRKHTLGGQEFLRQRSTHCDYMWKNLHQYGWVTRALVHGAYLTFQGINKLLGSYDKYLGDFIGQHMLARYLGNLLGTRVGMTLAVAGAAGISVPMAPLIVGLSTACACACGLALLMLLAAKATVAYGHSWRGDLAPQSAR
ncbi:MAG TPA: hypothetical protein VFV39_02345 [Limnobacter sp.]|nr:hypothetical protein [Limnobacter sp.]